MSGIIDLHELLISMQPELQSGEFVFCTVNGKLIDYLHLAPLATFREAEGLTLITTLEAAKREGLKYDGRYKQITLTVHSSLEAVGLTAAVAAKLTAYGISANVVAAYFHDHIFVQTERAHDAMSALEEFSQSTD